MAAVPFRGAAGGCRREVESGFALLGKFATRFAAGFGFAVKLLSHRSGSAHFAQPQNLDFEVAALILNGEHVSDTNFARGSG